MRFFNNLNFHAQVMATLERKEMINNVPYQIKFVAYGDMVAPATKINCDDVEIDYKSASYILSYDDITVITDPSIYLNSQLKNKDSLIDKYYEDILNELAKQETKHISECIMEEQ